MPLVNLKQQMFVPLMHTCAIALAVNQSNFKCNFLIVWIYEGSVRSLLVRMMFIEEYWKSNISKSDTIPNVPKM